jgi:tripartite-type tricarboxylate transporter receptor subunit TctC
LGYPPGGGSDTVARIVTPKLHDALGQQWVVDNRGGAAGNIATEIVTRALPDGYTVLMGFSTTLTVNPMLYNVPFDVAKDLQPVIMLAAGPYMLVVHPSVGANSVRELINLAKSRSRTFNYASSGTGSPHHLAAELFKLRAGIDMVHVPYKGGGPAAAAVLGGEVEVLFASLPSVVPLIKGGRIRPLAVTGLKRASVAPEVPTIAESGFPKFDVTSWYGLLLPARAPERIVSTVFQAATKALKASDVQEGMARQGLEVAGMGPREFTAQIRAESETWAKVIKAAGIRAE